MDGLCRTGNQLWVRWCGLLTAAAMLVGCASATSSPPPTTAPATTVPTSTVPTSTPAVAPSSSASASSAESSPPVSEPLPGLATPPVVVTTLTETPPKSLESAGAFTSSINPITTDLAARMSSSWRPGCPVDLADLSYLSVTYRGFDGADHTGELVVATSVAPDVVDIFRELYGQDYPIASMRLVDDFGADDDASMAADNTSAFNCRAVTGGGGFSEHSYGTAIDLNPVENPYISGTLVLPPAGEPFTDRHRAPGVVLAGDPIVTAFANQGWQWGGTWNGPIDYQHFSVSGR